MASGKQKMDMSGRSSPGRRLAGAVSGVFAVALIALVLAVAVAPSPTNAARPRFEREIDQLVGQMMIAAQVPGVSVLVKQGDQVLLQKGYGLADVEQEVPVTADTVFAIGSVTKQFTGLAIAQLVEAGKLSIDDSVGELLPAISGAPAQLTVSQLLHHTSGLKNYTSVPDLHMRAWEKHQHRDMLAYFIDEPLEFEPGSRWSYTNSGIYLLGMIIEAASGESYADYVRNHIFDPFGMTHSYYGDSKSLIPSRARGYDLNANGGWTNSRAYDASVPYSAGTLLSTASDLGRYAQAVLKGERVSRETHEFILTPGRLMDGEQLSYTNGCFFVTSFYGRAKLSHAGEIYGYYSQLAYYPEHDLTIVILTNRQDYRPSPVGLERKIARLVLGISQPDATPEPVEQQIAETVTGAFSTLPLTFFSRYRAATSVDGEHLYLSMGAEEVGSGAWPFTYVGNGRFVADFDDEITVETASGRAPVLHVYDHELVLKRLN